MSKARVLTISASGTITASDYFDAAELDLSSMTLRPDFVGWGAVYEDGTGTLYSIQPSYSR